MPINTIEELQALVHQRIDQIEKIVHGSLEDFTSETGVNPNFIRAFYMSVACSVAQGCIRSVSSTFQEPILELIEQFTCVLQDGLSKNQEPIFRKPMTTIYNKDPL